MANSTVAVRFTGDDSDLRRTLGNIDDGIGRVSSTIGRVAGALAGAFVAREVVDFAGSLVEAARESERVAAQTAQVIETTGNAANVSAEQMDRYVTGLSNLTGVDDEVIAQGANVLRTFTNIRSEVGDGNDVFQRATAAALDMSTAMGTDLQGSILQLGKAMNDPIAGLAGLGRAGVQFTDQQKDWIAHLVESGDTIGAQRIILAELERQFGGTAAAVATPMDRLKVAFGNIQEQLGAKLLPILDRLAAWLAVRLPGALDAASRVFGTVGGVIRQFFEIFANRDFVGGPLAEDSPIIDTVFRIRDAIANVIGVVQQFFDIIVRRDFTGGPLAEDSPIIDAVFRIRDALSGVVNFIRDHWRPILLGAAAVLFAITAPITATITALVLLYTRFEAVRTVVGAVVDFFTGVVIPTIATVATYIADQFGALVGWVQTHWGAIQEAVGHVVAVITGIITVFISGVQTAWRLFGDELLRIMAVAWDFIRLHVETAINLVRGVIELVMALINGDWGQAWDAFKGILATVWEAIQSLVRMAIELVRTIISAGLDAIGVLWGAVWSGFQNVVSEAWGRVSTAVLSGIGQVVDFVTGLPGAIVEAVGDLGSLLYNIGRDIIQGLIDGIQDMIGQLGDVLGGIGGFISDHKGPPSYDRVMLSPHGRMIMGGLIAGIASQKAALARELAGVSSMIDGGVGTVSVSAGVGAVGIGVGGAGAGYGPEIVELLRAIHTDQLTAQKLRQVSRAS